MTDAERRRGAWFGFAALLAGSACFYWSMDLDAVKLHRPHSGGFVDGEFAGWECALRYEPAYVANLSLAAAPIFWFVALWLRSPWARGIGAAACCAAAVVQATTPFLAQREGVVAFRDGFLMWVEASVLLTVAFAALPTPERPPPDEPLPREVSLAARRRFALLVAAVGTAFVLASQFFFDVAVPGMTQAVSMKNRPVSVEASAAFVAMLDVREGLLAASMMLLPLLFVVVVATRNARLRALGVACVLAVLFAQVLVRPRGYWWWWTGLVAPAQIHWYAGPAMLGIAFCLLPLDPAADEKTGRNRAPAR